MHGARAMAAALALALAGADVDACVTAALAELPEETEIGRNARHALKLAAAADSAFALIPPLEHQIVDHVYSYGIAAAETVPVALALATAARGRIAEAVPAAACLSRVADSAPALAGALTGALGGGASIPASWRDDLPHPLRLRPPPPHRHRPRGTRRTPGSRATGPPRRMIRP